MLDKKQRQFYDLISIIFMPLMMPLYSIFFLFQLDYFTIRFSHTEQSLFIFKWITISGTILFTIILPVIPLYILRKKGKISDFFISKREQRAVPYFFGFLAYVFWVFFLWHILRMPMYVVGLAAGSTIAVFLVFIINFKWKISAHTAGIGGFAGGVFGLCYLTGINPLWFFILVLFFSVLVGLARIELRAHTPSQALAGFILGFLMVFLCCVRF